MARACFAAVLAAITVVASHTPTPALEFEGLMADGGLRFLVVSGTFEHDEDLTPFRRMVETRQPDIVVFDSPGGSPRTAMALGRLIRQLGLDTYQPRELECSSACALAFAGGLNREADPGAIGVHRSAFAGEPDISISDLMRSVQIMTAQTIGYLIEMDVDPALLELSLSYENDDIRYLSLSEMAGYNLVTARRPTATDRTGQATAAPRQAPSEPRERIARLAMGGPVAPPRSGRIRHPAGSVDLRRQPTENSARIATLANGARINILNNEDRWYHVSTGETGGQRLGFAHHTWVAVDQYETGPFDLRHVQIKSLSTLDAVLDYARTVPFPVDAYLSTSGWFAITLPDRMGLQDALDLTRAMKARGEIPDDSYVTYGNTYIQRVCCVFE